MPGPYQDPVTGKYFNTRSEAEFQGMLHREMYFNDDGGAAARVRQQMEYERMEQERQRNIEREAWKQYQAKLKEQEERKRWMALPMEQKMKKIAAKAMVFGTYEPPTPFMAYLISIIAAGLVVSFLNFSIKMNSFWCFLHFFASLGSIKFAKTAFSDYKCRVKRDNDLVKSMKETARKTKSNAITIEYKEPLELSKRDHCVYDLRYHIYFIAKYGFKVTNPELQEIYNKTRETLRWRKEIQDLDWENLWNEKPRETAA